MATRPQLQALVSKFSTTTSSHSSTSSTLFDKLAYLEKFRDEPKQRWISGATLGMLVALMLSSTGGLIMSGLVIGNKFDIPGQCASQSFVLLASILAVPYLVLHIQAARTNFSIIRSQPFQHPMHSWTIIIARLAFLAWTVAFIASSVAVARASGDKLHLKLDLFFCVTAFLAMTFCVAIVELAAEPFILPWLSPNRLVCRVSTFGDMMDDSISRRGSYHSEKSATPQRPMSQRPMAQRRTPSGPRPLETTPSTASEPVPASTPDYDSLFPTPAADAEDCYAQSVPAIKMPEPTLPLLSERYKHDAPRQATAQSADWRQDWSTFAGEAGLRASGTSTTADLSSMTESSPSGSSQASAPYSVWTPIKPSQPPPAARSHRSGTLSSGTSKRSLLHNIPEVLTPTVDIFEFMGGYSSKETGSTLRDETRSDSGAKMTKPRGPRAPKVTVEDVVDEAFTTPQPGPDTATKRKPVGEAAKEPGRSTTPKIPGAFVNDYPVW